MECIGRSCPVINQAQCHEHVLGKGGTAPCILHFETGKGVWATSFPRLLQYPLHKKLSELQKYTGSSDERKHCPSYESKSSHPATNLVIIVTDL
jgi:hypothetical protein